MKVVGPIAKDTINDGTQIELGTKSVEHHMTIDIRGGEGSLVDLKHCSVDDGVQLDGHLVDVSWLKGTGNKHKVFCWSCGIRHVNDSATVLVYWKGNGGQLGTFKVVT